MNSKQLFASLLILAIIFSVSQSISLRTKHNHGRAVHKAAELARRIPQHMTQIFHLDNEIALEEEFLESFLTFVLSDQEVLTDLENGKPFSEAAEARIQRFLKDCEAFHKQLLDLFNDPSTPDCLKTLSDEQKEELIFISIDNMDIDSILENKAEIAAPDAATVEKIIADVRAEPTLGDDVATCVQNNL